MNKVKSFLMVASVSLAMSFIFSCTSADVDDLQSASSSSSSSESQEPGQFVGENIFIDSRDGKSYKYEIYNSQIWLSENLTYSRGNTLGYCYGTTESMDVGEAGADLPTCNDGYGRVYTWETAMDGNTTQNLCPHGWRIPSEAEWETISNPYGSSKKMPNSFYIYAGNFNLNNAYPPLGWRNRDEFGFYWSNTTTSDGINFFFMMNSQDPQGSNAISDDFASSSLDYFSIRCILNNDFMADCEGAEFNPVTHYCFNGSIVLPRAGW